MSEEKQNDEIETHSVGQQQQVCSPALLAACSAIIRARRESPRFIGRRSMDKSHGQVIECCEEEGDPVVVERINLPNFQGEAAASARAEILNDDWTAAQIISLVSQENVSDQATASARRC